MRRFCLAILTFAILLHSGAVSAADFMINVDGRQTTSLDGKWQYLVDPYEVGFYNYRWSEDPNGFFRNAQAQNPWDRVEYAFNNDHVLNVPGDWNSQQEKLLLYEGTVWYKKDFDDPRTDKSHRLFIYFGGANYETYVYVNGRKLGHHVGGFTPFQYDITDLVKPKGNFVMVKVDDKRHLDAVPTVNTDWWNYGGLTRRVMLIDTPPTYVDAYQIQLAKGEAGYRDGHVKGWVELAGADPRQPVTVSIPEVNFKQTFQPAEGQDRVPVEFDAKFELWTPEQPKLYDVTISAGDSSVTDQIGFRTIETSGTQILLNGKPIFLRGIAIHEEAPMEARRAVGEADDRTLLGWAKDLGCNYVRLAHYTHNEPMVRLADKMGLLVWGEIPVYWTIDFKNPDTYANAAAQLGDMIRRDRNRAAVIIWSVGNETPVGQARNSFYRRLVDHAHEQDPTRLVSAALEHGYRGNTLVIDDPLGENLDVLGCNEYIGWYDGPPNKADSVVWRSRYEKPLIISEMGAGAVAGMHGDINTMWTEERQRDIYEHQVVMLKKIPFLAGVTPWILKDFRSPRRPLYGVQDGFNRKGLISDRGQRKEAFYVLQKFYKEKAAEAGE